MGHMGAAMGHACAHTWPYMGAANGAYMRAYMGHIWGSNRAYILTPISYI